MDSSYIDLIQSDRVSEKTREVLLYRAVAIAQDYNPTAITHANFSILWQIVELLIPQDEVDDRIQIAERLDHQLSRGRGDGWRYANMPPDKSALNMGLREIERNAQSKYHRTFNTLNWREQTEMLFDIQQARVNWRELDPKRWFEELLAQVTEIYVSHPSTLSEMGFSGIAFLPAWSTTGLNTSQSWEPVSVLEQEMEQQSENGKNDSDAAK